MGHKSDLKSDKIASVATLLTHTTHSLRKIASLTGISKSSVQIIAKKLKLGVLPGNHRKGNCGAKRKTTSRTDRKIINIVLENRRKPIEKIRNVLRAFNIDVSAKTIGRRLKEKGIKTFRAVQKQKLNNQMIKKRLVWAKNHLHYTKDDWAKVGQK